MWKVTQIKLDAKKGNFILAQMQKIYINMYYLFIKMWKVTKISNGKEKLESFNRVRFQNETVIC